jgi:hypothetical protein
MASPVGRGTPTPHWGQWRRRESTATASASLSFPTLAIGTTSNAKRDQQHRSVQIVVTPHYDGRFCEQEERMPERNPAWLVLRYLGHA